MNFLWDTRAILTKCFSWSNQWLSIKFPKLSVGYKRSALTAFSVRNHSTNNADIFWTLEREDQKLTIRHLKHKDRWLDS